MHILVILLLISVIVTIHESGHFLAAKAFRIPVATFAIGFPPTLWSWKRKETTYKINALPLGGYVNLSHNGEGYDDNALARVPLVQQIVVLLAGIIANIVSVIVILWIMFVVGARVPASTGDVTISRVLHGTPAEMAGLLVGDRVESITYGSTSTKISSYTQIIDVLQSSKGVGTSWEISRNGISHTLSITPLREGESYRIGAELMTSRYQRFGPIQAFQEVMRSIAGMTRDTWRVLGTMIRSIGGGENAFNQIAGPVGLISDGSKMIRSNAVLAITNLFVLLSVNIAFLNLVPIPSLDGGQIILAILRTVSRHRVMTYATTILNVLGFLMIAGLIVLVTYHDILKLIS